MSKLNTRWINTDANSLEDKGGGALGVKVDDSSIEVGTGLNIKASGVTNDMLAGSIAFAKLADSANIARLDEAETVAAVWDFGANIPTASANPSTDNQFARKAYVDSVAEGLDVKDSVRAISETNITLSGEQTIDGVSVVNGDRVLVAGQSSSIDNGIYVASTGAWSRSDDMAVGFSAKGNFCFVEEGTSNADAGFVCTSNKGADTVGTHNLTFSQFNGAADITAGDGIAKSGNTLSLDLNELSAAVVDVTADSIPIIDATDGSSKKESLVDYAAAIAGIGLNHDSAGALLVGTASNEGIIADLNAVKLSLWDLNAADVDVAADSIAIVDATDNTTKKESIADVATAMAGTGISATNGVLAIDFNEIGVAPGLTVATDELMMIDRTDNSSKHVSVVSLAAGMAGTGIDASSGTLLVDLDEVADTAIDVAADSIAFIDATDSSTKKETVADFATAIAGAGLTATSGVLSVDGGEGYNQMHKVTAGEVTAGYLTLGATPAEASNVRVSVVGGIEQVNKQIVGATGVTGDFDVLSSNQLHINNNGAATALSGDIIADDILIIGFEVAPA